MCTYNVHVRTCLIAHQKYTRGKFVHMYMYINIQCTCTAVYTCTRVGTMYTCTLYTHALTMPGSWDLETQQVMSFSVSFFTVLMPAIRGCLVTSSPDRQYSTMYNTCLYIVHTVLQNVTYVNVHVLPHTCTDTRGTCTCI